MSSGYDLLFAPETHEAFYALCNIYYVTQEKSLVLMKCQRKVWRDKKVYLNNLNNAQRAVSIWKQYRGVLLSTICANCITFRRRRRLINAFRNDLGTSKVTSKMVLAFSRIRFHFWYDFSLNTFANFASFSTLQLHSSFAFLCPSLSLSLALSLSQLSLSSGSVLLSRNFWYFHSR